MASFTWTHLDGRTVKYRRSKDLANVLGVNENAVGTYRRDKKFQSDREIFADKIVEIHWKGVKYDTVEAWADANDASVEDFWELLLRDNADYPFAKSSVFSAIWFDERFYCGVMTLSKALGVNKNSLIQWLKEGITKSADLGDKLAEARMREAIAEDGVRYGPGSKSQHWYDIDPNTGEKTLVEFVSIEALRRHLGVTRSTANSYVTKGFRSWADVEKALGKRAVKKPKSAVEFPIKLWYKTKDRYPVSCVFYSVGEVADWFGLEPKHVEDAILNGLFNEGNETFFKAAQEKKIRTGK